MNQRIVTAAKSWGGWLASAFLAFYTYELSISEREPLFVEEPKRIEVADPTRVAEVPFKIVDSTGQVISSPVTAITAYFINRGKLPITRESVRMPLELILLHQNARILSVHVDSQTRDYVGFDAHLDPTTPTQKILLSFDLLNRNDGAGLTIIFSGDPKARIKISGGIEGVEEIGREAKISETAVLLRSLIYLGVGFLGLLLLGGLLFGIETISTKLRSKSTGRVLTDEEKKKRSETVDLVFWIVAALFFFGIVYSSTRAFMKSGLGELVPATLRKPVVEQPT